MLPSRKDAETFTVKNINQEVFLNVSEVGTTAGAVTTVDLALLSADPPERVVVNSPFIFSIWDAEKQTPLIAGIINDPTK